MTTSLTAPVYDAPAVASLFGAAFPDDGVLAACGAPPDPLEGFVTFFDPGMSIVRLRAALRMMGCVFYLQCWYNHEPFALAEDAPRYRQVRMQPVPDSRSKWYDAQVSLLADGEEVPPARVVVAALVIHSLASGQRLLPRTYVRCADRTTNGHRVVVGYFEVEGLVISDNYVDQGFDSVQMLSARK